jgi:hypothetical protein
MHLGIRTACVAAGEKRRGMLSNLAQIWADVWLFWREDEEASVMRHTKPANRYLI